MASAAHVQLRRRGDVVVVVVKLNARVNSIKVTSSGSKLPACHANWFAVFVWRHGMCMMMWIRKGAQCACRPWVGCRWSTEVRSEIGSC